MPKVRERSYKTSNIQPVVSFHTKRCLYCSCFVSSLNQFFLGMSSKSNSLQICDLNTLKLETLDCISDSLTDMVLSQDQKTLFLSSESKTLYFLDVKKKTVRKKFKFENFSFFTLQLKPNSSTLFILGDQNKLLSFCIKTFKKTQIPSAVLTRVERGCLTISKLGTLLYGSGRQFVGSLDLKRGNKFKPIKLMQLEESFRCNVLSHSQKYLFSGSVSSKLYVTDTRNFKLLQITNFSRGGAITRLKAIKGLVIGGTFDYGYFIMHDQPPFKIQFYLRAQMYIFNVDICFSHFLIGGFSDGPVEVFENRCFIEKKKKKMDKKIKV